MPGGVNPLVGAGISVDSVVGLGTSLNPDVTLDISNGVLNFTTGDLTGFTASTWNFGGGATTTITLVGGIPDLSIYGTLLTGYFDTATVSLFGTFKIAGSGFFDTKEPTLLAYYGLPNTDYIGNFNISFDAKGDPPGAFTSSEVFSGDITNVNEPVPEPGTLLLLGAGLVGLAGYGKLRLQRRKK